MTGTIINNYENNSLNNKCIKCSKIIKKKILNQDICHQCHIKLTQQYYNQILNNDNLINDQNIKKERKKRIKSNHQIIRKSICHELDYINKKGEIVKVNVKNEYKICNLCNLKKYYTEFYMITDKNKKNYLLPKCISCIKLYYNNKHVIKFKLYLNEDIKKQENNNELNILNNNIISEELDSQFVVYDC